MIYYCQNHPYLWMNLIVTIRINFESFITNHKVHHRCLNISEWKFPHSISLVKIFARCFYPFKRQLSLRGRIKISTLIEMNGKIGPSAQSHAGTVISFELQQCSHWLMWLILLVIIEWGPLFCAMSGRNGIPTRLLISSKILLPGDGKLFNLATFMQYFVVFLGLGVSRLAASMTSRQNRHLTYRILHFTNFTAHTWRTDFTLTCYFAFFKMWPWLSNCLETA